MDKKIVLIMSLSILCHLMFFGASLSEDLTEWWDSAEYLLLAKSWAKGTPTTGWAAHREVMPAVLWFPFFKLGIGEFGIRVFMMLIGLANVYVSYLTAKKMYNSRTGLFVAFMMSVFYLNLFYVTRLTMYVIAPLLFQLAIYFFWSYHTDNKLRDIIICFLISGVGMTIYYNTAFVALLIGAFFLITNKKFFKNLDLWKAGIIVLLVLTPYFIYSYLNYGHPIPRLAAVTKAYAEEAGGGWGMWNVYLKQLPHMMTMPPFIFFIAGLVLCYPLFLTFDQIIQEKSKKYLNDLFVFLWMIIPLILYTYTAISAGERGGVILPAYLMAIFPAFFIIMSKAVYFIYDNASKIHKSASLVALIVIVVLFGYFQLNLATTNFVSKIYSYREIREAGRLIQDITRPEDTVVSASVPQLTYYSEREVIGIGQDQTEAEWEAINEQRRPRYLLLTKFEPHPAWINDYPNRKGLQPIMVFGPKDNPTAVLFEFKWQDGSD